MPTSTSSSPATLSGPDIRAEALRLGFDAVGIAHPDSVAPAGERLRRFLAEGRHGDMGWLADKADRRAAPGVLWPEARSVLMVGLNYALPGDPLARLAHRTRGVISVYAQGSDYHDVLKVRLKRLGRWIGERSGAGIKVFVDTAPVLEKPLAAAAGLGWQGKHTNLVSREFGSWLFLGAIFTTLVLDADRGGEDACGSCQACLDICPTQAFPAPRQLDARRCISYLTIEHRGHIAAEFRAPMGNRIYGCDDCLAVCPWNKFARAGREAALLPRAELALPRLADLAELDDAAFRTLFAGSPIKRVGRDRFVRNVMIAVGNSGDPGLAETAAARLRDGSPLVRAMAVWALARLADEADFVAHRETHLSQEADEAVRAEWLAPSASAPAHPP
jgi:epoxyqueuosine reductase